MKKTSISLCLTAFVTCLALPTLAQADLAFPKVSNPLAVTPLDTFSFDISGYNQAGTVGYLLTPDETVTFGTTGTFTAAGVNSQDISYTSSETVNGTTTTDTVTISTPTNFVTTANVNGTKITQLQFDLGNLNSGSNTIDYSVPVTGNTATGIILYSGGSISATPTTTLTNSGMSLAAVEGVNAGSTAITGFTVHSFTYSVTYNTFPTVVPEPSSLALGALGLAGCAGVVFRRRRAKS